MIFDAIGQIFSDDPATTVKTALRFTHFIGLALGLGGATLLPASLPIVPLKKMDRFVSYKWPALRRNAIK